MLLIPFTILSNAGKSGIVVENQRISVNDLPEDIHDLLIYKKDVYNISLIEDLLPKENTQITLERSQIEKQRKLVFSENIQEKGSFVRVDNIALYLFAPDNAIPAINQSYGKIIIGDIKAAKFGGIIEKIYSYHLTPIITISKIDFFAGGLIVVLLLTFLLYRMVALWNIPAIITCYSLQFFLANRIAGMNQLQVNSISMMLGFLFILAFPLTLWIKKYEETEKGKQEIYRLYIKNKKLFFKLRSKFGL